MSKLKKIVQIILIAAIFFGLATYVLTNVIEAYTSSGATIEFTGGDTGLLIRTGYPDIGSVTGGGSTYCIAHGGAIRMSVPQEWVDNFGTRFRGHISGE